jgi:hypothetical protein
MKVAIARATGLEGDDLPSSRPQLKASRASPYRNPLLEGRRKERPNEIDFDSPINGSGKRLIATSYRPHGRGSMKGEPSFV